jgi:hypothetical protein
VAGHFEHRIILENPNGGVAIEALAEFQQLTQVHRVLAGIDSFPLKPAGVYHIKVWLRKKGDDQWSDRPIASYPLHIEVTYGAEEPATSPVASLKP